MLKISKREHYADMWKD